MKKQNNLEKEIIKILNRKDTIPMTREQRDAETAEKIVSLIQKVLKNEILDYRDIEVRDLINKIISWNI